MGNVIRIRMKFNYQVTLVYSYRSFQTLESPVNYSRLQAPLSLFIFCCPPQVTVANCFSRFNQSNNYALWSPVRSALLISNQKATTLTSLVYEKACEQQERKMNGWTFNRRHRLLQAPRPLRALLNYSNNAIVEDLRYSKSLRPVGNFLRTSSTSSRYPNGQRNKWHLLHLLV